jgi:uncharacterized protein YndB with AHSA1/START domain
VLHQLFYRGPSIEVLHEEYAKHGRVDEHAPVCTSTRVEIDAPVGTVWALLSDPTRWPSWDPGIHDVATDAPTTVDARFRWSNGRARMRSRFAVVEPGREITWTGVAAGAKAVHRNVLTTDDNGTTVVSSEESMAGPFLVLFMNGNKLHASLDEWLAALKLAAESAGRRL